MIVNSFKLNPNYNIPGQIHPKKPQAAPNFMYAPLSCSIYKKGGISFRGDIPLQKEDKVDKLYSEYKNSLDTERPLKVMDMLETRELDAEETVRFMRNITGDRQTAFAFIEEVTRDENGNIDPSKSPKVVNALLEKFEGAGNFNRWYTGKDSYTEAFQAYTEEYFENAKSLEELYAWLPNWDPSTLRLKYRKLADLKWTPRPGGGFSWEDGYTIGKLPDDFGNINGNKEKYRAAIAQLVENVSRYDHVKGTAERDLTDIDVLNGLEQYGFKSARLINAGLSPKHKVILDGKYIIKIDRQKDHNCERDFYNYLNDIRPDTAFMNSMIDHYIMLYGENRTPKHYFYDDYTGTNVYEYLTDETLHFIEDNKQAAIDQFNMLKKDSATLHKIGIYYRDFNPENFIPTEDGLKCVDTGKCVYFDLLKPELSGTKDIMTLAAKTEIGPIEFSEKIKAVQSIKE